MNEEILHKGLYAVIPANVRYDTKLKDKAKLLYGEISALSNEKGYCWASNKYFAELYSVSITTISLLIKNLIDRGYLKSEIVYKEGTKEIKKRYLILIKEGIKENLKPPIKENLKENNTSINNIKEYYNSKNSFSKINKLTDSRKKKLLTRLQEQGEENIIKAIDIASESDFLKGKNDRNWKMDFDWLIANDTNIVKVLEGKYCNKTKEEKGRMYGPILN